MSLNFTIRHYQKSDRPSIRKICCDTADCGKAVESFFFDREIFADLVTRYYTDFEPHSCWVALKDDRVIGYLTGCLNTFRYVWLMSAWIFPGILMKAFARGVFFRLQTWRLLGVFLQSFFLGGFGRKIPRKFYQAHLHVDIREGFRGQGIGQRLFVAFQAQAEAGGIRGMHVSVREDNLNGSNFFARMGFKILSRHPMVMLQGNNSRAGHTLIYLKSL